MKKIAALFAVLLSLLTAAPVAAQVPNFPQTLPQNSVVGRLGIGPGPAQAIPFLVFTQSVLANSSMTINGVSCAFGVACTVPIGVSSISGNVGAFTLSNGISNLVNDIRLANIPGGTVLGNISGVSGIPSPVFPCPVGTFCVANFGSASAAFAAATSAGGGVVYFSQSTAINSPITVTANIRIECSSTGVVLSTNSTTADMLVVTGNDVTVTHCGLDYSGTNGTKTAGVLLKFGGLNNNASDLAIGDGCFICIQTVSPNAFVNLTDIQFVGNLSGTMPSGSGNINLHSEESNLTNINVGASATASYYETAIHNRYGAMTGTGLQIATAKNCFVVDPSTGDAAFAKVTNSYLDNCSVNGAVISGANGGTVGYAEFVNTEFGVNTAAAVCVNISKGSGNVGTVKITNSEGFNYNAGISAAPCLNVSGAIGELMVSNSIFGTNMQVGFSVQAATSFGGTVIGNSFRGSTAGIFLASLLPNSLIMWNRMNGSTLTAGGNAAANVANNLP